MNERPKAKAAVLVRGHAESVKLSDLASKLHRPEAYDLYIAPDETRGPIDPGPFPKVPHTLKDIQDLGFDAPEPRFFVDYADVLFALFRKQIPGYEYYILIEYDVEITKSNAVVADLVRRLTEPEGDALDMVATFVWAQQSWWSHWARASKSFPDVWSAFFPIVALSSRAIDHLYQSRLAEVVGEGGPMDRVFCEAFAPSALKKAGFAVGDLNDVLPGAYTKESFFWGPPMLFQTRAAVDQEATFLHPVYPANEHLPKHLAQAAFTNTLLQYAAALADDELPISADMRAEFVRKAREALSERPRPAARPPSASSAEVRVILLPNRPRWHGIDEALETPSWIARIGDRPILTHVIDYLRGQGVSDIVACLPAHAEFSDDRIRVLEAASGSAAAQVGKMLETSTAPRTIVCYGDCLGDVDLAEVLATHEEGGKAVTLVSARPSPMLLTLSGAVIGARDDTKWLEGEWVSAGILVLEREASTALQAAATLEEAVERLRSEGRLGTYSHRGFWELARDHRTLQALDRIWRDDEAPWSGRPSLQPDTRGPAGG